MISSLIIAAERGESSAAEALFGALYSELHRVARRELARRRVSVSLSATTLLHEAYLAMGAQLVDLKFFCGFSLSEIARMRGVTERTVQRHWDKARIYLHRSLETAVSC
jgi:DNA-directed RNA polymerase specialized sigma24 family protein